MRQIGEGGFGIVYLAWDAALERHVAIKEYMPSSLAVRGTISLKVSMRSEQQRETFDAGLKSFVNEARLLARFDHPALVKVFRYWEANGTAYMAMPYYEGPTLKTAIAQMGTPVPEALLREWLHPMLDALSAMHREHCYHRDISPDNILLTATGPLLLDFGAARHVISDRTQALTTMLKPGFAPVEQYGGTVLQGAWTDLYALAGVVHYAITGRPPLASVVRVVHDPLQPLAKTHAGQYSAGFLRAIDAALAVRPEARPQDVTAFRALLGVDDAANEARLPSQPAALAAADAASVAEPRPVESKAPTELAAPFTAPKAPRRSKMYYAIPGLVVLLATGTAWMSVRSQFEAAPAAPAARAAAAVAATPAAPAEGPSPVATPTAPPLAPTPSQVTPSQVTPAVPALPASRPPAPAQASRLAARKPAPSSPMPTAPAGAVEKNRTLSGEVQIAASYTQESRPPRCSELVLKSSLESLSTEEIAFQKNRCK
ncbi:MAG: serine/threonine-protein kinase [Variovorax sp.]